MDDQVINPNNVELVKDESKNKRSQIIVFLLVIILICITGIGGYYLGIQRSKEAKQNNSNLNQTPTAKLVAPTISQISIRTWKTYTDPNKLYSFQYPEDYSLGHYSSDNSPLLLNNRIDWGITQHPVNECKGDCPIITSTKNNIINGYSVNIYEGWIGSIGGEIPQSYIRYEIKDPIHITPEGNNFFVMTLWELNRNLSTTNQYDQNRKIGIINDNDRIILGEIISTFKFLETNSSNEITYKYNNFSFTYPNKWKLSENTGSSTFFSENKINGFDHMIVLENGDYYFIIGIDTNKTQAEVSGIFTSDTEYQDYLDKNDEIVIQGRRFYLSKINTTLEQWNNPNREVGIYALASLSEYIPNKITNDQNKVFNGYDFYIKNKDGNSYMFIKLSKTGLTEVTTPSSIQSDIKQMLQSISW